MTHLLEEAYARITQLPASEQDTIASLILEELDDDERWSRKFAASANLLSRLAQEALAEHRSGKTLPLDPNTL